MPVGLLLVLFLSLIRLGLYSCQSLIISFDKHVPSVVIRVTWAVFVLIMIGYFCFGASLLFDDFLKKKIITKIKMKNAENLTVSHHHDHDFYQP